MTTPTPLAPAPAAQPSWVPTRKWIAAVVTNVLTLAGALVVAHFGLHESSLAAGEVSAVIALVAGGAAGYAVKEIPIIEADVTKDAPKGM